MWGLPASHPTSRTPPTVGVVSPVCNKKSDLRFNLWEAAVGRPRIYTEKDLRPSCLTRGGRRDKLIWDFVCRAILISWTFNTGPPKESKWPIFKGEKLMVLNLFGRRSRPNFSIESRERLLSSAVTISRCPKKMGWLDPIKGRRRRRRRQLSGWGKKWKNGGKSHFVPSSFRTR